MKYFGLVLIPVGEKKVDFAFHVSLSMEYDMEGGDECVMEVVEFNCSSLSSMYDKVCEYLNNILNLPMTEDRVKMCTYLGLMQVVLRESENRYPIPQETLDVLRQYEEYKDLQSDSGYYFYLDVRHKEGIEAAVRKHYENAK